ncbi:50S ribosomal protein L29 [Pontibacter diazotrophicus]|uniref:Large ribosomal subunit protein uL29 n=1 Tax=Pontibacter diazotrophicus TaxID=1400979 RepID=A0A3D8LCT2_9BACT|nr:50S ribosomal protein L29 [Pontibacter diazotrophicus]RDV15215.1 50S ribosomal protein L29 [Pontibacter diazotrophicus]
MKNSEIKALSSEELNERLNTERANMQNLRFAHAISPLENPMKIREAKRNIARLNTEKRSRELANS